MCFRASGLAASVAGVTEITDKMLYLSSVACMESMTQEEIDAGRTFPSISQIRSVSLQVAVKLVQEAIESGMTTKVPPKSSLTLQQRSSRSLSGEKCTTPPTCRSSSPRRRIEVGFPVVCHCCDWISPRYISSRSCARFKFSEISKASLNNILK